MTVASSTTPREIVVRNPATGDEISRHFEIGANELRAVIQKARDAQRGWSGLPLEERARYVRRMRDWLVEHADDAANTIGECSGKTRFEALTFDVLPSVFGNAWYARHAHTHLAPERLRGGSLLNANKKSVLFRKPLGVVGIISPWNYPLGIPMHEIVPALLCGNAVVFKTAPETVPVGELIESMCRATGVPENVFNHVIIDGPACGDVMLEKGSVNKLFFTGSVRVGKLLAEKAARNLVPVSLELGGKDAMLVLDDANLERAAAGAVWAGMQNCGQSCAGVERVYVQREVHDDFLAAVKREIERLREDELGVMTTERQVETVRAHLEDAVCRGATVFARAPFPEAGHRLAPTVLTGVNHEMRAMREETFGPVIGVVPFDTGDEAIALANDSPFGLTASVWSRDAKRAERIACRIEAGVVTINDHLMSHGLAETPWGGPGDSGLGRGHGRFAFDAMTEMQVVVHDRLGFARRNLWWFPVTPRDHRSIRGAIVAGHGKGIGRRLGALWQLIRGVPKMFRK